MIQQFQNLTNTYSVNHKRPVSLATTVFSLCVMCYEFSYVFGWGGAPRRLFPPKDYYIVMLKTKDNY